MNVFCHLKINAGDIDGYGDVIEFVDNIHGAVIGVVEDGTTGNISGIASLIVHFRWEVAEVAAVEAVEEEEAEEAAVAAVAAEGQWMVNLKDLLSLPQDLRDSKKFSFKSKNLQLDF